MKRIGDKFRPCRPVALLPALAVLLFLFSTAITNAASDNELEQVEKENRAKSPLSDMGIVQMIPTISLFNPSSFVLSNENHTVSYSDKAFGLPSISVALNHPIGHVGKLEFSGLFRLGYGFKSMTPSVIYPSGVSQPENLFFHLFPVAAELRVLYEFPTFTAIRPGLIIGTEATGVIQRGSTDTLNRTYLVPSLLFGIGLSFLDTSRTPDDWFGGFSFDTIYQTSLGQNRINGLGFSFGVNVIL